MHNITNKDIEVVETFIKKNHKSITFKELRTIVSILYDVWKTQDQERFGIL